MNKENKQKYISPLTDVIENDDEFVMYMETPGVEKNDVRIDVEDDTLTVFTTKEFSEDGDFKPLSQEYEVANYKRVFNLNNSVDVDKINATMENGVLRLNLAKSEKLKPRKIEISA